MFVIFDFDGTLCKIDHRLHYIQRKKKNWDKFYSSCVDDVPNAPIIKILRAFVYQNSLFSDWPHFQIRLEIWSGRSEQVKDESRKWLIKHGINPGFLTRMRQKGDYTPDHILKKAWLEEEENKPDLVFDDRQRVVDMWRSNNITCAQVDSWEEKK